MKDGSEGVHNVELPLMNTGSPSWFDISEEDSGSLPIKDQLVALDEVRKWPFWSSLRVVDEVLEFELSRLAGVGGARDDGGINKWCSLSEGEPDEAVEEGANKCFDSDSMLDIPLKQLRGVKKKEQLGAMERRNRSKIFF